LPGIVYACIAPHGAEVIPELAAVGAAGGGTAVGAPVGAGGKAALEEALRGMADITRSMEEIGLRLRRADPDTIVIASPHNLRLEGGSTAVVTAAYSAGTLTGEVPGDREAGVVIEASFPCDRVLARNIVARAGAAGIPVVGVNFGGLDGPVSLVTMDWGTLIPLYFMGRRTTRDGGRRVEVGPWSGGDQGRGAGGDSAARPRVVVIGPSRDVARESLVRLGEVVAEAARASGRRVAFVASADHGHAHRADGPYGHAPASASYDEMVCDMVRGGRLERLLELDSGFVEAAKPDSLWQMLILLGVLRKVPMKGELLSYRAPTYFGMMCASFVPSAAGRGPS